mgnify:CR=1 FL=1
MILQKERLLDQFIRNWDGMADVQRELGITRSSIAKVCKGKARQTGGFKWKYFEEETNLIVGAE